MTVSPTSIASEGPSLGRRVHGPGHALDPRAPRISSSDDSNPTRSTEAAVTTAPGDGTAVGPTTTGVPATAPDTAPVADIVKEPVVPAPRPRWVPACPSFWSTRGPDVEARVPGETAGPAVWATIEVRNDSSEPFDLSSSPSPPPTATGPRRSATTLNPPVRSPAPSRRAGVGQRRTCSGPRRRPPTRSSSRCSRRTDPTS